MTALSRRSKRSHSTCLLEVTVGSCFRKSALQPRELLTVFLTDGELKFMLSKTFESRLYDNKCSN